MNDSTEQIHKTTFDSILGTHAQKHSGFNSDTEPKSGSNLLNSLEESEQETCLKKTRTGSSFYDLADPTSNVSTFQTLSDDLFDRIEKFLDEHELYIVEPSQEIRFIKAKFGLKLQASKSLVLSAPNSSLLISRRNRIQSQIISIRSTEVASPLNSTDITPIENTEGHKV